MRLVTKATLVLGLVSGAMAASESPIGNLESELKHSDSYVSFYIPSFELVADECALYFSRKGQELDTSWWNVRLITGNEHVEWRVILSTGAFKVDSEFRMCRVVMDFPKDSDRNYSVYDVTE